MVTSCRPTSDTDISPSSPPLVNDFIFQLQRTNIEDLLKHPADLIIVDIDDSKFTKEQIQQLQQVGKKVIAYLSIGEAEIYRDYWEPEWNEDPPSFIDTENPDWEGNFKVRYWDEEWQDIILKRLKDLAKHGVDGVYLDIVDAYYYYQTKGRKSAAEEMINFVSQISQKGKSINPQFLVIPQNALDLVTNESYQAVIDGVGKEDTWFDDDERTSEDMQQWDLSLLKQAYDAGKFVLMIDYPRNKASQCEFVYNARSLGYVPYVGVRALDRIVRVNCT